LEHGENLEITFALLVKMDTGYRNDGNR